MIKYNEPIDFKNCNALDQVEDKINETKPKYLQLDTLLWPEFYHAFAMWLNDKELISLAYPSTPTEWTKKALKVFYFKASLQLHPDRVPNDARQKEKEDAFKLLSEYKNAYENFDQETSSYVNSASGFSDYFSSFSGSDFKSYSSKRPLLSKANQYTPHALYGLFVYLKPWAYVSKFFYFMRSLFKDEKLPNGIVKFMVMLGQISSYISENEPFKDKYADLVRDYRSICDKPDGMALNELRQKYILSPPPKDQDYFEKVLIHMIKHQLGPKSLGKKPMNVWLKMNAWLNNFLGYRPYEMLVLFLLVFSIMFLASILQAFYGLATWFFYPALIIGVILPSILYVVRGKDEAYKFICSWHYTLIALWSLMIFSFSLLPVLVMIYATSFVMGISCMRFIQAIIPYFVCGFNHAQPSSGDEVDELITFTEARIKHNISQGTHLSDIEEKISDLSYHGFLFDTSIVDKKEDKAYNSMVCRFNDRYWPESKDLKQEVDNEIRHNCLAAAA